MRVITLNVNGIRAAVRKGFFEWLRRQRADVVCLQETRAQEHQLRARCFRPRRFHVSYYDAERPGYSGVALYSVREPDRVQAGLGWPDVDAEARYLQADFGDLSVVSLYLPSGSSGEHRQTVKFSFMERFMAHLRRLHAHGRRYILSLIHI